MCTCTCDTFICEPIVVSKITYTHELGCMPFVQATCITGCKYTVSMRKRLSVFVRTLYYASNNYIVVECTSLQNLDMYLPLYQHRPTHNEECDSDVFNIAALVLQHKCIQYIL